MTGGLALPWAGHLSPCHHGVDSERTCKALLVPLGGGQKEELPEEPRWGPRGVNPRSVLKATLNYGPGSSLPGGGRSSAELEAGRCPLRAC